MSGGSGDAVWDDLDENEVGEDMPPEPRPPRVPRPVVAAVAGLVIIGAVWAARSSPSSGSDLPIERTTAPASEEELSPVAPPDFQSDASFQSLEEARTLLALAAAEIVAVRDVAEQADVPPQRLRIVADQTAGHLARITRFRRDAAAERTSADELAAVYRDHIGHELLVRRLLVIESRARDLALLDALHFTAVRGIDVVDVDAARAEVERTLVMDLLTPAAAGWANALLDHQRGTPVDVEAARVAALQEWPGLTGQVGGVPASEELSAYIEGLDPDVVQTLRSERYFDGVLRYLVDRGVQVPASSVPTPARG